MQIKFSNKGTTLIVGINGELDHHSAEYIRQKVDGEIIKSSTKNVIFDLSNVSFMDSSGIGVIIGRYKNIQKLNGKTALTGLNEHVKRIFDMAGLLKIIPAYGNVESALKNF
ncbi:MAG: anti-sigma F factor antagonist [Clostridia bacterium]|nr:anti-sigma F factor antagonist [Clostridia bacterium]